MAGGDGVAGQREEARVVGGRGCRGGFGIAKRLLLYNAKSLSKRIHTKYAKYLNLLRRNFQSCSSREKKKPSVSALISFSPLQQRRRLLSPPD